MLAKTSMALTSMTLIWGFISAKTILKSRIRAGFAAFTNPTNLASFLNYGLSLRQKEVQYEDIVLNTLHRYIVLVLLP
jgi:hypothetical protein